ncbi:Protein of unknown function [Natrinema salaciae]|uniref:DUF1102 domain-containing protein n=2 Tax=Natrinema salaciae TaxID=1186196 RepID=A0A1H9M9Q5_9EURY|nr:Protein of unknown function [Natrinema salaciae]
MAAAVGSGAFSSVTATRDVDVDVADDASAYLRLEGTGGANSDYVTDDGNGGTLTIDLSPSNGGVTGGGEGVNPDAITRIDDLFVVENQGTQAVDVALSKSGANAGTVEFYPDSRAYSGDPLSNSAVTLAAGSSATISLEVDTEGEDLGDGDELLDAVMFSATAN